MVLRCVALRCVVLRCVVLRYVVCVRCVPSVGWCHIVIFMHYVVFVCCMLRGHGGVMLYLHGLRSQ